MNYFDQNGEDDESQEFRDQPDEIQVDSTGRSIAAPDAPVRSVPQQRPQVQQPVQQAAPVQEEIYEEVEEQEEDLSVVLSDARLRLEQGKLYELVLQNDLFVDTGIDERAVKHVQKEIRKFAQERMEIMLGMRQEQQVQPVNAFPAEAFPFNALEVQVLKALASTATQGASAQAEAYVPDTAPVQRRGLSPIAGKAQPKPVQKPLQPQQRQAAPAARKPLPQAPAKQVKRPTLNETQRRILEEEGLTLEQINEVFPPDYKPLDPTFTENLTPEQIAERNLQGARRTQKQVPSQTAMPMPDQEQINAIYSQRAQSAAANPQMQTIMNLLTTKK